MMLEEPRTQTADREIKVRLSREAVVKLHTLKVLAGKTISETVEEAVEAYFARLEPADYRRPAPASATA